MERLNTIRIKTNGGTQPRGKVDDDVVREYATALREGAVFPPVTVFYDGNDYWLADGFHRHAAHLEIDRFVIDADVRQGTRRDAVLFSVGANAAHGLRRSNADKRRAVETLLRDAEWGKWVDAEIARRAAVSPMTVGRIRQDLISNKVIDAPAERVTSRNGTTYTQNTANIGQRPAAPAPAPVTVDAAPLAFVEPATRIAPAAEFPPHDPETGEVIEAAPTYSSEFLEAAHRPMSPMPYQLPALEQVQTDATIEELRRVLGKLLSFRGRVEPEVLYGDLVGVGVMEMAGHAHRMLGDWLTPADTRDVFTVDAQVVTL